MVMVTKSDILNRREEILALAKRHGASNIRVFGSVARGDATATSDLDLIVRFEPGRSLLDQGSLLMDLQDLLGIRVDLIDEDAMRPRFRHHALQEAIAL
jgi:predicted nucleotidyltransferase